MSESRLSERGRALVDRPVIASFTTINEDGSPHTTPLWIDRDGDVLRVNTAAGRVKARNVARDPRVSVCLVDPEDPMNVVAVRGTVTNMTTNGADAHIDKLANKYTGAATFAARTPGQQRLLLEIRCDEVLLG